MLNMFKGCSSLTTLPDISKWNTNNLNNMKNMFQGCSSLISMPDINKWIIRHQTNISGMFDGCSSLSILPSLLSWDVIHSLPDNIKPRNYIFKGCISLIKIPNKPILYFAEYKNGKSATILYYPMN